MAFGLVVQKVLNIEWFFHWKLNMEFLVIFVIEIFQTLHYNNFTLVSMAQTTLVIIYIIKN